MRKKDARGSGSKGSRGGSGGDREDVLAPNGRIGAHLRALYAEIEQQPIPEQLIELLARLDDAEAAGTDKT